MNQLDAESSQIIELSNSEPHESFVLELHFSIKLERVEERFEVRLIENRLLEAMYKNPTLISILGKDAGTALDCAVNIGGSEVISESFFAVMRSQQKDNLDIATLDMRTLIKMCISEPSKCPNTIDKICKVYRDGNAKKKVARHRENIFHDKRQRSVRKYGTSKAVDSHREREEGCQYMN